MEDTRCCGSGSCIINAQGDCWCGQKWDGTRMCFPEKSEHQNTTEPKPPAANTPAKQPTEH